MIRDRDEKYGTVFSAVARSARIKELKTPVLAPRANAVCERFIGSLKRECLDHIFVLHQRQLYWMVGNTWRSTIVHGRIKGSGSIFQPRLPPALGQRQRGAAEGSYLHPSWEAFTIHILALPLSTDCPDIGEQMRPARSCLFLSGYQLPRWPILTPGPFLRPPHLSLARP